MNISHQTVRQSACTIDHLYKHISLPMVKQNAFSNNTSLCLDNRKIVLILTLALREPTTTIALACMKVTANTTHDNRRPSPEVQNSYADGKKKVKLLPRSYSFYKHTVKILVICERACTWRTTQMRHPTHPCGFRCRLTGANSSIQLKAPARIDNTVNYEFRTQVLLERVLTLGETTKT